MRSYLLSFFPYRHFHDNLLSNIFFTYSGMALQHHVTIFNRPDNTYSGTDFDRSESLHTSNKLSPDVGYSECGRAWIRTMIPSPNTPIRPQYRMRSKSKQYLMNNELLQVISKLDEDTINILFSAQLFQLCSSK